MADRVDVPGKLFDALLCIDSFIYFGADDLYLDYLHHFVRPGGQIGIVVPGFMQEVNGPLPEHLLPFWAQECLTWHTVDRWHRLWERTGLVKIETVDTFPQGAQAWLKGVKTRCAAGEHTIHLRSAS
jgi:hypothetical protein